MANPSVSLVSKAGSPNAPATLRQLSATGNWTTEPEGNVVILRGVNLVSKTSQTPEQLGFDERHAKLLATHGFNVVRLGISWCNVQPYLIEYPAGSGKNPDEAGNWEYDYDYYLSSIKRTIDLLSRYNIYTLVDFHQDAYSVPWGYGAPLWALNAGANDTAMPNTPSFGFPVCNWGGKTLKARKAPPHFPNGVETDANYAFDAFWNNNPVTRYPTTPPDTPPRIQDLYGLMLLNVAYFLSDQKGNILGYDPMNEPTPGANWVETYKDGLVPDFSIGCLTFDTTVFVDFYMKCAIPNLRKGHPEAIIWFEPDVYFDLGAPTFLPSFGSSFGSSNVGFNFHNYDQYSQPSRPFTAPIKNAKSYGDSNGIPLLCSEFGGATPTIEQITAIGNLNDQNCLSAIFWAWFNNAQYVFYAIPGQPHPPDPRDQGIVRDMRAELVGTNVNTDKLTALTRVYPQVVGGTPLAFAYDPSVKTFHLEYTTKMPNGKISQSSTQIVVPTSLYPNAFTVNVTNGTSTTVEGFVSIKAKPSSSAITVTVDITPNRIPNSG